MIGLALLPILLAAPAAEPSEITPQAPARVELLGGWTCHTESDCASSLSEGSLGYRLRLTERGAVIGRLTLTAPGGEREGRDASTFGGGGDVGWRWHLRPSAAAPLFDPFVELTAGALGHLDRWPPGGTRYVLRRSWALGLTLHLAPGLDISAGLRQQHLSNGQGLGPHNPAFDGLGAFIGLGFLPHAVPHPLPQTLPELRAPDERREPTSAVLQTQLSLVEGDGELGPATRVEARVALSPGGWTQVRVDAGRLVGIDSVAGELDFGWQGRAGALGISGGLQSFGGLIRRRLQARGAWYVDRLSSVTASVGHRTETLGPDAVELRTQWLLYPLRWVALGVGYEYTADGRPARLDRVQPAVSVELAPPPIGRWGFSLVAEREIGDLRVFSLRYTAGVSPSDDLRARDRTGGLQPMR